MTRTTAGGQQRTSLYPRLLGAAWDSLDAAVQRLHIDTGPVRATGTFRVWHGRSRLVRLLVRLLPLPPAAMAVPMRLTVTPCAHGERWCRTFGGTPLRSTQSAGPSGLLAERMSLLELQFRLEAREGMLCYRAAGAAIVIGPRRLPLPRWLAPRVLAHEAPGAGGDARVSVAVLLPVGGLLVAYAGHVRCEGRPC